MNITRLEFDLHLKQGEALTSNATEILYGGAAGSGKSHLLRVDSILHSIEIPGLQTYLFRRTHPDLMANHMDGPASFPLLLAELTSTGKAQVNRSTNEITFFNGSKIHLCHCQHEQDVYKYQGAEIHNLLLDEATHFTGTIYKFLRSRVRLGGLTLPERYKHKFPRILCGSNPGNIGHTFFKGTFIDPAPPMKIWRTPPEEGGMLRQFIPARLEDNPTMTINDPQYRDRLLGLGGQLAKAMLDGDWDVVAGAAFEKLTRERCMIRSFTPPRHFTKFMVIDWGTAKPFAVGWFCVVDENLVLNAKNGWPERFIPKDSLILYREWYGWNGNPDEGCGMESFEVARRILQIEKEADEKMDFRIGDSAMWNTVDGPSVERRMFDSTGGKFIMAKSRKDRIQNYQEFRARINGSETKPQFYATENCLHFWRTVPGLQLDALHPEKGHDTKMEDHIADICLYACAEEPVAWSEIERKRHRSQVWMETGIDVDEEEDREDA